MSLKFYHDPLSPVCRSVQLLLEKEGVLYEAVHVKLGKGETRQEEFRGKFPLGKVPAIEDGGLCLAERFTCIWHNTAGKANLTRRAFDV